MGPNIITRTKCNKQTMNTLESLVTFNVRCFDLQNPVQTEAADDEALLMNLNTALAHYVRNRVHLPSFSLRDVSQVMPK